jgi:hypothetical protein
MRGQANAISAKLTGGTERYMKDVTNKDSPDESRKAVVKKPYKVPSFRFESVFEVSALT